MPKVSVIIPVYNVEKYIKECLNSIVNQTFKDIEIICVDDGSTDDSLSILNEYAKKDSRITVLTQKNQGAAVARNRGIEIAKGEYLSILDSDDFFDVKMLEKMYNKAIDTDADIVICEANRIEEKSKNVYILQNALRKRYLPDKDVFNYADIKDKIFQLTTAWAWNKLFKKDYIIQENVRFQNLKNINDFYFGYLALLLAKKITTVNDTLVMYRTNSKAQLTENRDKGVFCFAKAALKLRRELIKRDIYKNVEQSFINVCIELTLLNVIFKIKKYKNKLKLITFLKEYYFKKLDIENKPKDYFYDNLYNRIQEFYHPMYKIKKNIQRFIIAIKIQYN